MTECEAAWRDVPARSIIATMFDKKAHAETANKRGGKVFMRIVRGRLAKMRTLAADGCKVEIADDGAWISVDTDTHVHVLYLAAK